MGPCCPLRPLFSQCGKIACVLSIVNILCYTLYFYMINKLASVSKTGIFVLQVLYKNKKDSVEQKKKSNMQPAKAQIVKHKHSLISAIIFHKYLFIVNIQTPYILTILVLKF